MQCYTIIKLKDFREVNYMGLRFRKSIKICKGVSLNLGKTGASISFGTRGLRQTIHTSGRMTSSIGIPGTGISYVKSYNVKNKAAKKYQTRKNDIQAQENQFEAERYNDFVNNLVNIHRLCDDYIDWESLLASSPFKPGHIGPKQAGALEELNNYNPSFFERMRYGDRRRESNRRWNRQGKRIWRIMKPGRHCIFWQGRSWKVTRTLTLALFTR